MTCLYDVSCVRRWVGRRSRTTRGAIKPEPSGISNSRAVFKHAAICSEYRIFSVDPVGAVSKATRFGERACCGVENHEWQSFLTSEDRNALLTVDHCEFGVQDIKSRAVESYIGECEAVQCRHFRPNFKLKRPAHYCCVLPESCYCSKTQKRPQKAMHHLQ